MSNICLPVLQSRDLSIRTVVLMSLLFPVFLERSDR